MKNLPTIEEWAMQYDEDKLPYSAHLDELDGWDSGIKSFDAFDSLAIDALERTRKIADGYPNDWDVFIGVWVYLEDTENLYTFDGDYPIDYLTPPEIYISPLGLVCPLIGETYMKILNKYENINILKNEIIKLGCSCRTLHDIKISEPFKNSICYSTYDIFFK
ncbi:hypothetical protein SH611_08070 [Geminicoccaceae bacterium 1502E]|nr:hypothetical protein [Geminicoccaceae bacterium 1502E]